MRKLTKNEISKLLDELRYYQDTAINAIDIFNHREKLVWKSLYP